MRREDISGISGQRQILNVLLSGTIIVSGIALLINIVFFTKTRILSQTTFHGDNPLNVFGFFIFFVALYMLFKRGHYRFVSIVFVNTYIFIGFYCAIKWGANIPFSYLIYSLAVVLGGIIINGKFALVTNFIITSGLMGIIYLQSNKYINFDGSWIYHGIQIADAVVTGLILTIISLVSWLSNKEIEKSFKRAVASERELKIERDNLEVRVRERTEELKKTQLEKMLQMYKFAEFGKLAAGLIHELVNPLASVSINLEQLHENKIDTYDKKQIASVLKRAVEGTQEMEHYVAAARKQIQQQETIKKFSLYQEIKQCIKMFSYRAKTEGVRVNFNETQDIHLYGNPIKFHHIVGNLLANALDAYRDSSKKIKQVVIECYSDNELVTLKVSDRGKGIVSSEVKKIFDPFFTTKKEYGTGIGLSITRDIVVNTFHGSISAESSPKKGTTFIITFPQKRVKNHA